MEKIMQENSDSIGAMWIKEKNGKKYMTGVIEINGEKINIVVFKNGYKKEDKHPDYRILRSRSKSELSGNSEQLPDKQFKPENKESGYENDEIPF
jgi:uncharacterized protein (DUF736 family)